MLILFIIKLPKYNKESKLENGICILDDALSIFCHRSYYQEDMTSETNQIWETIKYPGYLGKSKEQKYAEWDSDFGRSNWRLAWHLQDGRVLDYAAIFFQVYVTGYSDHFQMNPDQSLWIAKNASYTYDKDLVTKEQAFDPFYLYERPGFANQFHNVALNLALVHSLGIEFQGLTPLQVREGKPGTDPQTWPAGWRWSPSRIPASNPELIPQNNVNGWWKEGSIEDLYQRAKVLQVRRSFLNQILDQVERTRQGFYE